MSSQLSLRCNCGETMVVPASVMGKLGLCPYCGAEIRIMPGNTKHYEAPPVQQGGGSGLLERWRRRHHDDHQEAAGRKFAEAVDLYNQERFAEALALLEVIKQEFPDNPHVIRAEAECVRAMNKSRNGHGLVDVSDGELTPELVQRVIMDKMLHGSTEAVQLEAAMLAARLLGMVPEEGQVPEGLKNMLPGPDSDRIGRVGRDEIP